MRKIGVEEELMLVDPNTYQLAGKAYAALGCRGLARVDFFLTEDGKIYVNELNTLPGFTNISMYPKCWEASGIDYSILIEKLILLGLENQHVFKR